MRYTKYIVHKFGLYTNENLVDIVVFCGNPILTRSVNVLYSHVPSGDHRQKTAYLTVHLKILYCYRYICIVLWTTLVDCEENSMRNWVIHLTCGRKQIKTLVAKRAIFHIKRHIYFHFTISTAPNHSNLFGSSSWLFSVCQWERSGLAMTEPQLGQRCSLMRWSWKIPQKEGTSCVVACYQWQET